MSDKDEKELQELLSKPAPKSPMSLLKGKLGKSLMSIEPIIVHETGWSARQIINEWKKRLSGR